MRTFIILFYFVIFSFDLFSLEYNSNNFNNLENKTMSFRTAYLFKNDYSKITVKNLKIYKDYVTFLNLNTQQNEQLPIDELSLINARTGTCVLEGMFYGILGGLAFDLGYYLGAEIFHKKGSRIESSFYYIPCLIGATLGAIIGASYGKYETIYHTGDFFISLQKSNNNFITKKFFSQQNIIEFNFNLN